MLIQKRFQSSILLVGLLIIISLNANFFLSGCSRIKNKKYVSEKVTEMYTNVSRNPLADMAKSFNENVASGNVNSFIHEQQTKQMSMEEFNDNCVQKIMNDPKLKEYFDSFCKRMSKDEVLSIETLNYYGIALRRNLEKDLDIDIVD